MLLIESQILPPISVYQTAISEGGLLIEACENYQKKSMRNKFYMAAPSGRVSFSVPLKKGKSNQTPITSVSISYDDSWIMQLSSALKTNYGSSAYFDYYYDELISIFENRYQYLFDLNMALLLWTVDKMDLDLTIRKTKNYVKQGTLTDHLDQRNKSLSFYNNSSSNNGEAYDQVYADQYGFLRNLSIVDLIFNRGPESKWILSSTN